MSGDLLILGAGGHARVIAALVSHTPWRVVGVLDTTARAIGERVGSHSLVGTFDDLDAHFARGVRHVALGIGDNGKRAEMFERCRSRGFEVVSLRHPSAMVETNARLGVGVVICIGAILGAEVSIGDDVIVNSGAIIDHECVIGDHAHVAPGTRLAGRVRVGRGTFVGIGTAVKQQVVIGEGTTIGAGSVVVDDIPAQVTAFGNPARVRTERVAGGVA